MYILLPPPHHANLGFCDGIRARRSRCEPLQSRPGGSALVRLLLRRHFAFTHTVLAAANRPVIDVLLRPIIGYVFIQLAATVAGAAAPSGAVRATANAVRAVVAGTTLSADLIVRLAGLPGALAVAGSTAGSWDLERRYE